MKILVLNPYLPTLGGGEKAMGYLCQFMEEYFKGDVSIDILVYNYNAIDVASEDYVTIEKINKTFDLNLKKTKIVKKNISDIYKGNIIYVLEKKYIENISKNYDLFINHMFLSKHCGKAKHNVYLCMFPPKTFYKGTESKNIIEKLVKKYYDYAFYRSYELFVSISQYTKHWLTTYWKRLNENIIIYPPVFSCKDTLEGRYNSHLKENIILSVGRFFAGGHSKCQIDIVKFFVNHKEIFKNYEYHLVGNVSNYEPDLEYLEQVIKLASSVNNVFVHTNMPYEELVDLYKKAKIFWHATGYGVDEEREPEKMEHFGITTIEAMSYGAVPVVINKGAQKETVEDGVSGYRWAREEECIEKTKKLIEDEDLIKQMAGKASDRAGLYSVDTFYENNRKMLERLGL